MRSLLPFAGIGRIRFNGTLSTATHWLRIYSVSSIGSTPAFHYFISGCKYTPLFFLHKPYFIQFWPVLAGNVYPVFLTVIGNAVKHICIRRPEPVGKYP